jgi:Asp/Glu/hydantoin racemase
VRELAPVPVTGLAESALHLACMLGRRIGIVTGGDRWPGMLADFYAMHRLEHRLAGIRAVAPTGAEIARDPDGAVAQLREACSACARADGADVVILAGAGLAGLAGEVGAGCPVPVICSLEAGLRAALALAALRPRKATTGSFAPTPPVASTGLSPGLAGRLAG